MDDRDTTLCRYNILDQLPVSYHLFPYSFFADFTGHVVSVLDGDTLEVLHNQHR